VAHYINLLNNNITTICIAGKKIWGNILELNLKLGDIVEMCKNWGA
jgi:hypothetical protein